MLFFYVFKCIRCIANMQREGDGGRTFLCFVRLSQRLVCSEFSKIKNRHVARRLAPHHHHMHACHTVLRYCIMSISGEQRCQTVQQFEK